MIEKREIMIHNEESLRDKIYVVRGVQVMLDFELAEIYGYETKSFNRQVKNNIERFEGEDFRFQLTKEELENLRCKNFTSSWGGTRYLPYAFTEQGVYMLMTVLHGKLATKQSRMLVMAFKAMKDYIVDNQSLLPQKIYITLAEKVEEHSQDIKEIKDAMVTKTDLSDFMKLFDSAKESEEILILDGQPFKADDAYQKIYRKAKKNIIVIDDYIGVKTLRHLAASKKGVKITIISDNKGRTPLRKAEYDDFATEYPERDITFIKSQNKTHDRYIILDYRTSSIIVYHCGASSKDAGRPITTITEIKDSSDYNNPVKSLLSNPVLALK